MSVTTHLDAAEITSWLTRVTQTIDRSLREPVRATVAASLQLDGTRAALPILIQLALLDDCLRVAHQAIEADGQRDADELARIEDLVKVAANKYFAVVPHYEGFAEEVEIDRFLKTHRDDAGRFGFRSPSEWSGLELVRQVEKHTRNASPLREHERMLARIMDEVFAGRSTEVERRARKSLRAMFERPTVVSLDPRVLAFCRPDAPEVFASVAHGSQIHIRDPFDVESIHSEVRGVFHSQVARASTPEQVQRGHGRTLLVLGESGSGKTHLLRALRSQVHSSRLGYVGYLQMTSEVGDYSRYVLRSLIDSMERPYDAPVLHESALMYLSDGLAEGRVTIPPDELERLRTAVMTEAELDETIGTIIDRVIRTEGLEQLESDLVHALLLLQRRDPALQRRVVKYLRCESLTRHDRELLGGLAARDQPEDPLRTLKQLASCMYELQMAAMIILVDQIEETIPDGQTVTRLQQAFDSLRAIADAVPSAVVVISCLDDVYESVRPKLSRSLVDRLENDPSPVRLTGQRQVDEIEQMLVRRLEYLYSELDVPWRDDEPLFPFTPAQLEAVSKFRARDVLARFRDYHASCIAAGELIGKSIESPAAPPAPAPVAPDLDRLWNDRRTATLELPDDDDGVLLLVEHALRAAVHELDLAITLKLDREAGRLIVDGRSGKRVVAVCNRLPQGGHLGKQLEALKKLATKDTIPFALRNGDFQFKAKSATATQIGSFLQAGGRTVPIQETELRAMCGFQTLVAAAPAGLDTWRKSARPISQLGFVRTILDLDLAPAPAVVAPTPPPPPPPPAGPPQRISTPMVAVDPTSIRLGVTTSLRAEPQTLSLEHIKSHVTFVGGTGSGKTTAALHVIEQLLERGVSALLLDRKGDLARYASEAWWNEHPDRQALRARIDVELYTPGNSGGRPLRLPIIPTLHDASAQERTQLAQFAARGLAAMMGYGNSTTHSAKISVLQCAIQLHAGDREPTLDVLLDTINRPDPDLLNSVGSLQRHFSTLSEDLQSLLIQRGALLTGEGALLDVNTLLPPQDAKPKLSIINTSALTEIPVLQFWVSRLLIELARLSRKRPTKTLQGVAFFDEADAYVPAIGAPPTKEPMFDLLRRARSGGIGILLATQNPGDFDYKARDNIATWLVGKVAQDRAIEKMRNLIGQYPNVGPRLATQPTGHFFVLANGRAAEVRCDRSLMQTEQMSESDVVELARAQNQ